MKYYVKLYMFIIIISAFICFDIKYLSDAFPVQKQGSEGLAVSGAVEKLNQSQKTNRSKYQEILKAIQLSEYPAPGKDGQKPANKITIYRADSRTIYIYSQTPDNGHLITSFVQKSWGTWNLQYWMLASDSHIPAYRAKQIAGSDTDWEYVLRVAKGPNSEYEFSGGNHGNEVLKDITLIDPANSREFGLNIGDMKTLDSLVIAENTGLVTSWDPQTPYAYVERIYEFGSCKITFESRFKFTRNTYIGTSYVCMFPIPKDNGRNIRFNDSGNIYTLPRQGETLSIPGKYDNYIGKEAALSADIWSGTNPEYVFRTWIDNPSMTDNFRNKLKVFYWDMNKWVNKLYFSRFDNQDYQCIPSGTEWNNKQGWELVYK